MPNSTYLMDQINTFGIGTASLGGILLVLGIVFVTCLNMAAENQVKLVAFQMFKLPTDEVVF